MDSSQDVYKQKYLKYKQKYLDLKNQKGGVRYCNTDPDESQWLYNIWQRVQRALRENYGYGTIIRQTDRGSCNLWVWDHNYSGGYSEYDRSVSVNNHIDVYLNGDINDVLNIDQISIGITPTVTNYHQPRETETYYYNDDEELVNDIYHFIIRIMEYYFPYE
jgi:hypothetical protein